MLAQRAEDLLVVSGPFIYLHRVRIADFAVRHRLPTAFSIRQLTEAGGLLSYAPSLTAMNARAATYVAKILAGAKPADLPVERPTKFDLVIMLRLMRRELETE